MCTGYTFNIFLIIKKADRWVMEKKKYLWCVLSIIVGFVIFVAAGINKRITFCDEIYTYMIVNAPNGAYQLAEGQWYTRQQTVDMLGHSSNDSVVQMLRNVKGDPHPPLYYGLVYIASFFGGLNISEWPGLSVNLIMYIVTVLLFWLIIDRIFGRPGMAAVAAIVYALNVGTLSDAMLIRMYMQLTFFTIAFAYVVWRLCENKEKLSSYVLLGVVTAGGFLTQYYFCFIPIAFFVVWAIYNIAHKNYSCIIKYLVSMFAAVAVDTIVWHYWIGTLLSNNNSGAIKENAMNFVNIFNSMFRGFESVQLILFQKWHIVGGLAVIIVVVATLLSKRVNARFRNMRLYVGGLSVTLFLYSTIVYYLTPTYLMSSRYFYAVSAVEILLVSVSVCALVCTFATDERIGKKRKILVNAGVAVACLVMDACILAFGYGIDYYTNVKTYDTQSECLEEYSDIPWVLCGDENWEMTANFMDYIIPDKLMRITENTPYGIENELEKADKFMIVARTNEGNTQGDMALYYYIGTTGRFAKSELVMERNGLSYFLAYPAE